MSSSKRPDDPPPGPKRGAIPTPKDVIERAKPFVPDEPPPPAKPPKRPSK